MAEPTIQRKSFLINPKLQLSITLPIALVMGVACVGYLISFNVLAEPRVLPESSAFVRQGHIATAAFSLTAFLVSIVVGLRVAHRIAGPVVVVERAVRGLREGRHDYRLQLRKDDLLKSLANEVACLSEEMQARDQEDARLKEELRNAAWDGDVDTIRSLLQADVPEAGKTDEAAGERRTA